jgi:arylsulfatase B
VVSNYGSGVRIADAGRIGGSILLLQRIMKSLLIFGILLGLTVHSLAVEKPNVVIILADDLGWAGVGYHSDWGDTPNIDRLAKEGIELDRFYVAPMCSPTRAGLMTGRYPIRFGLARAVIPPQRNFGLPVSERTIAELLAGAGYAQRGVFGKWHLGHQQAKWHPLARGFTHFEGHYNGAIDYFSLEREGERDWHVGYEPSDKNGYATDLITSAATEFITKAAADESAYFCYVPFNAPHSPFQAKPEDIERYAKGKKPTTYDIYRAMIWSMDQGVGKILAAIDGSGEADNTQVWFMSDNGGVGQIKGNNAPLNGNKLTTFEGGVRVAACVRWPAAWTGGRKFGNTVGYIDVLPTVLASAGVVAEFLDGADLGDLLVGKEIDFPERDWYSYHGQSGEDKETIAIKTAEWKLIVNGPDIRTGKLTGRHEVHLYKMPDDLLEMTNLADKKPQIVDELFQKLVAHRKLQPANGVPVFRAGKKGFKPPKDWRVAPAH